MSIIFENDKGFNFNFMAFPLTGKKPGDYSKKVMTHG